MVVVTWRYLIYEDDITICDFWHDIGGGIWPPIFSGAELLIKFSIGAKIPPKLILQVME